MKKVILLMCIVTLVTASFLGTEVFAFEQNTFKDIDMHWAEEDIKRLKNMGVMKGYAGFSNPDSVITRGEFTALIVRAFGFEVAKKSKEFTDVGKNHIFYEEIAAASEKGIIGGFPDGSFRPDNIITREEIMLIISRLTDEKATKKASFIDIGSKYEYMEELSKVSYDGIIGGYPDGSFRPYNKTTSLQPICIPPYNQK